MVTSPTRSSTPAHIRQVGDPVLRTPTTPVVEFGNQLAALVDRMWASMHAARGVGLAANQIGVGLSVFVYDVEGEQGVLVNPGSIEVYGDVIGADEGCLSVAGQVFSTPRHERAVVRGLDVDGRAIEVRGVGLLARCLQHETDHLAGKLYLDHLGGRERRAALQAAARKAAERDSGDTTRPSAFGVRDH